MNFMPKATNDSNPIRIMIIGGSFAGRGAEAMMLVVGNAIKKRFSNAIICILISSERDIQACEANDFFPVKAKYRGLILRNLYPWMRDYNLALSSAVDPRQCIHSSLLNPFRTADVVIDISGFATGDPWGRKAAFRRWQTSLDIRYGKSKIIYMPQSWGPFEDTKLAEFTARMLKHANLVFAREQRGFDALKSICGGDSHHIHLMPDIAFQFKPAPIETANRILRNCGIQPDKGPVVGISPNIRIYEKVDGVGPNNIYVNTLIEIITRLCKENGVQVLLIPHETWQDRPDDMQLCSMLIRELESCRQNIFTLSGDNNAAETKAIIGKLDFLIASRYHSLVAALSMRIPVSVLGWADKYDDLMARVELSDWAFDPVHNATGNEADGLFKSWEARDLIRSTLVSNIPCLEKESMQSLNMMLDMIMQCTCIC